MNHDRNDDAQGLYGKYTVTRTDGLDAPGERHEGCRYFVLDVDHDLRAVPAIFAYASACELDADSEPLATGLRALGRELLVKGIKEIYTFHGAGGNAHIVLDDENVDNESIQWCLNKGLKENVHEACEEQLFLERHVLFGLLCLPESTRAAIVIEATN